MKVKLVKKLASDEASRNSTKITTKKKLSRGQMASPTSGIIVKHHRFLVLLHYDLRRQLSTGLRSFSFLYF